MLIEAYLEEENKYKSNSNFYEAQTILNGMLIRARDKICSRFANTNIPSPNPDPSPYPYYPCPYPYPYPYYIPIVTCSVQSQSDNDSKKEQLPAEYYVPTRTDGGK